ncbi:MAG: prolyl oligopeptidase family serine peptidase, partial [Alphaproteobacteria bacterium]|nr:prolyl oligopeptidase family serine peptidase [Alphaproteobacteria bacterium]
TPDLFKCGISVSAVLNIPSMIRFDKKFIGGKPRTKTMGLQGKKPKEVSPYHRADEINAPLLIIHAKDDFRVRFRQAEKMVKKLKKLKKDVTFVVMEDGGHTLDTEASRITKLSAMEKFLKKHIGQ